MKYTFRELLPPKPKNKIKPWMTTEILELNNQRREAKRNQIEYRRLFQEIRNACQKSKAAMLNEYCRDLEDIELQK